jgi:hypothetical protein
VVNHTPQLLYPFKYEALVGHRTSLKYMDKKKIFYPFQKPNPFLEFSVKTSIMTIMTCLGQYMDFVMPIRIPKESVSKRYPKYDRTN